MAKGMTFEERANEFFNAADTDGEGSLSRFELCKVCRNCGCKKETEEMSCWFDDLDTNDDDKISKDEFMKALAKIPPQEVKEADLRTTFQHYDADGSGYITVEDLKKVLAGEELDVDNIVLGSMDVDSDGKVSYEEFLQAFRG